MGLKEGEKCVRKKNRKWNMLRIGIIMMRRGLSKRITLMHQDLQVLRKKGFKVFRTTSPRGFGLHDYEFSFSNSPANPPLHFTKKKLITAQHYFPCIQPHTDESPTFAEASNWLESCDEGVSSMETNQLAQGEELSTSTPAEGEVDIEAEEFIDRFYKQIKFQRQISELQYQEMLARGAS